MTRTLDSERSSGTPATTSAAPSSRSDGRTDGGVNLLRYFRLRLQRTIARLSARRAQRQQELDWSRRYGKGPHSD